MRITDVRIRITNNDNTKMKALASVTFDDCFVLHDIKVIQSEKTTFIAMPSKKDGNGEYKDIAHPLNSETRKMIQDAVLEKYNAVIEQENLKE